jgi:hypothetical protein
MADFIMNPHAFPPRRQTIGQLYEWNQELLELANAVPNKKVYSGVSYQIDYDPTTVYMRDPSELPPAAQAYLKTSLENIAKRLQQSNPEIAEEIAKKMENGMVRHRYEMKLVASLYEYLHKRMLGRLSVQNPSCRVYSLSIINAGLSNCSQLQRYALQRRKEKLEPPTASLYDLYSYDKLTPSGYLRGMQEIKCPAWSNNRWKQNRWKPRYEDFDGDEYQVPISCRRGYNVEDSLELSPETLVLAGGLCGRIRVDRVPIMSATPMMMNTAEDIAAIMQLVTQPPATEPSQNEAQNQAHPSSSSSSQPSVVVADERADERKEESKEDEGPRMVDGALTMNFNIQPGTNHQRQESLRSQLSVVFRATPVDSSSHNDLILASSQRNVVVAEERKEEESKEADASSMHVNRPAGSSQHLASNRFYNQVTVQISPGPGSSSALPGAVVEERKEDIPEDRSYWSQVASEIAGETPLQRPRSPPRIERRSWADIADDDSDDDIYLDNIPDDRVRHSARSSSQAAAASSSSAASLPFNDAPGTFSRRTRVLPLSSPSFSGSSGGHPRPPLRVNPPINSVSREPQVARFAAEVASGGEYHHGDSSSANAAAMHALAEDPWSDILRPSGATGQRLPISHLQGVSAGGRELMRKVKINVANFVPTYWIKDADGTLTRGSAFAARSYFSHHDVDSLLSLAIRDEYGHLDVQRERDELAKILHRWDTEQNPKIALEAARQRYYHEWSEAVWGGLDRIVVEEPEKQAKFYISPIDAAWEPSDISAAQVIAKLGREQLETFVTALTGDGQLPLRGWLQQSAVQIISALGWRFHNDSAAEGAVILAKILIPLLPSPPLQRMIDVDPELAQRECKIKRSLIFLMEKAYDCRLLDWELYMKGAARAGVTSLPTPNIPKPLLILGCRLDRSSGYLLDHVPELYQTAVIASIHRIEYEWLFDTVLQRVAEPEHVLTALFAEMGATGALTADWNRQVSIIGTICRVIIGRLQQAKTHASRKELEHLPFMMIDWLPCKRSRAVAAACFWAHETTHSSNWFGMIDLEMLEEPASFGDPITVGLATYNTRATYQHRIVNELQERSPTPDIAKILIDGLKCIANNISNWLLPIARDQLRKNLKKCGVQTLRNLSTKDGVQDGEVLWALLWDLVARGRYHEEFVTLVASFDPQCPEMRKALAAHGDIFPGKVATVDLYRMLDTLTGAERGALLDKFGNSPCNTASYSIEQLRLLEEYVDTELDHPDIKPSHHTLLRLLTFFGSNVATHKKIVAAILRCSQRVSKSIQLPTIKGIPWLALITAHRGGNDTVRTVLYRGGASITWDGSSPLSVVLRNITNISRLKNSIWTFSIPDAIDAGGVRREFYASAGDEIREHHMEPLDGYGMPRPDANLKYMHATGIMMARAVDHDNCVLGLELHPAVLAAITLSQLSPMFWTGLCDLPWAVTKEVLGENWCRLLAPESWEIQKATPENSNAFAIEYLAHYNDHLSSIASLVDGWRYMMDDGYKVYPPQQLDTLLRGDRSCDVVGLDRILIVCSGMGQVMGAAANAEAIVNYRTSFLGVLRKWNLEKRRKLYRFWFGCEQPNRDNGATITIVNMVGLPRAYAHTCGGLLKLAWIEGATGDALALEIEAMLDRSLENQQLARNAGQLFQMA